MNQFNHPFSITSNKLILPTVRMPVTFIGTQKTQSFNIFTTKTIQKETKNCWYSFSRFSNVKLPLKKMKKREYDYTKFKKQEKNQLVNSKLKVLRKLNLSSLKDSKISYKESNVRFHLEIMDQ